MSDRPMNFPLSSAGCKALEESLITKRDGAKEPVEKDAYHEAIQMLHRARMAEAEARLDRMARALGVKRPA